MDAQSAIIASKLASVSQMRRELSRVKEENATLRSECETLNAHFALALLAAKDLSSLPAQSRFVIIDGWNAILGEGQSQSTELQEPGADGEVCRDNAIAPLTRAHSPAELLAVVAKMRDEQPDDFFWVIFDGHRENSREENRIRVSYTGGTGQQRADRLIIDFVRMARYSSLASRIDVLTRDKRLLKEVAKLQKRPSSLELRSQHLKP